MGGNTMQLKPHVYSDIVIDLCRNRLMELSMKDSTPKRYTAVMFEAAEIIEQLRNDIKKIKRGEHIGEPGEEAD